MPKRNYFTQGNILVLNDPASEPENESAKSSFGLDRLRFIGCVSGFSVDELAAFVANPNGFLSRLMPNSHLTYRDGPFVIEALVRAEEIFGRGEAEEEQRPRTTNPNPAA